MTTTEILERFEGVMRVTSGWMACCPGHDDSVASLSVSEGRNGGTVLMCQALKAI